MIVRGAVTRRERFGLPPDVFQVSSGLPVETLSTEGEWVTVMDAAAITNLAPITVQTGLSPGSSFESNAVSPATAVIAKPLATIYFGSGLVPTGFQGNQPRIWWENGVYALLEQGLESQALRMMYRAVEDLLLKRNFEVLDKSLARIELVRLGPELMVALLRSTYRARLALKEWLKLRKRVIERMQALGVDHWERLLVGL